MSDRIDLNTAEIAELSNEGMTVREIARRFNVSIMTIHRRMREMNIYAKKIKKIDEATSKRIVMEYLYKDVSQDELGRRYGVSRRTIRRCLENSGVPAWWKKDRAGEKQDGR